MATCIALANILAAQFLISHGLTSRYNLQNRNYSPAYHLHGYKTGHKYQNQFKNYHLNDFYIPHHVARTKQNKHHQKFVPIGGRGVRFSANENAERKITFYENLKPDKINTPRPSSKKSPIFENFVTPKLEPSPKKNYDATTKMPREFVSTARPPRLTDNDMPIAIDDEEAVEEDVRPGVHTVKGRRRPEHLNPLVYMDSYGKALKRPANDDVSAASIRDYGLERPGRVVVHHNTGHSHGRDYEYGHDYDYAVHHHPSHHYKKHTGRVRVQVFRGPTRKYGRKRYTPWGYYVVQPADDSHHYQHHYP